MRWTIKIAPPSPKVGDTRGKHGFLFLPMVINGEGRWLEYAEWVEELKEVVNPYDKAAQRWELVRWTEINK